MALATSVAAQYGLAAKVPKPEREYSPNLSADFPDRFYFGDTHLHASYSVDAGILSNRLGPDAAYRFVRGER